MLSSGIGISLCYEGRLTPHPPVILTNKMDNHHDGNAMVHPMDMQVLHASSCNYSLSVDALSLYVSYLSCELLILSE